MRQEHKSATVLCHSQSAIHLSKNAMFHERTKHVDVRLHFVREIISRELVSVENINTKVNPADMLTKVIRVNKLKDALGMLNILEWLSCIYKGTPNETIKIHI